MIQGYFHLLLPSVIRRYAQHNLTVSCITLGCPGGLGLPGWDPAFAAPVMSFGLLP